MFDLNVFLLTFENVGLMVLFIAIGFALRRCGKLPEDSGRVMSLLATMLFTPAYTIRSLANNFTIDSLAQKASMLSLGLVTVICALALALLASRLLGRNDLERRSLTYAFTIPNYGYFGYPVVDGVFGAAIKADMIIFCIPSSIITNSIGYLLFDRSKKFSAKRLFLSPMLLGVLIGSIIGLSGLQLPAFAEKTLSAAANCMSPISMLLAGFILGKHPLKWLLSGWRAYVFSAIRLLVIPAVFAPVLLLFGVRDTNLLLCLLTLSLPLGLNLVVFPESYGYDADDNAQMCFVSYLMAILILPFNFTFIQYLAQLP